jgi:hypothetical protein
MQIVINIPDEKYDRLLYQDIISLRSYVENGTVLPKGHGRLIDADALKMKMCDREEKLGDDRAMWESSAVEVALDMFAPTIIEAESEVQP